MLPIEYYSHGSYVIFFTNAISMSGFVLEFKLMREVKL